MIHRVHDCLFNCCEWVVRDALRLRPVRVLDHTLTDHAALQVSKRISYLLVKWTIKRLLDKFAAAGTMGKNHHINLRSREELRRPLMKKQHADIPRPEKLFAPVDDVQPPAQLRERQSRCFVGELAADLPQIVLDQREPQVFHRCVLAAAVVERDRRCQAE